MMKLGSAPFVRVVLALSAFPGLCFGARVWNSTTDAGKTSGNALRGARTAPAANASEAEAPIVVVEIVDDGAESAAKVNGTTASSANGGLSEKCEKEMIELEMNQTRFMEAKACEESKNSSYVQQTFDALQRADKDVALATAAASFHKCAGLSTSCAKEVAPQVVLKFRLSGATISKTCGESGQKRAQAQAQSMDKTKPCQENTTHAMIKAFGQQDLEAAMDAAQFGLATCAKLEHPCDFQLAPILVMQLMQVVQEQEQEQITEVLFAGMRAAEEASAGENASEAHKGAKGVSHKVPGKVKAGASSSSAKMAATAAKVMDKVPWKMQRAARNLERRNMPQPNGLLHKAKGSKIFNSFSLLDVNERVRIAFRRPAH